MRSLYAVVKLEQVERAGDYEYESYSFLSDVQIFKTLTEARRWIEKDALETCQESYGWSEDRKHFQAMKSYQDGNHWVGSDYIIKLVKNPNKE